MLLPSIRPRRSSHETTTSCGKQTRGKREARSRPPLLRSGHRVRSRCPQGQRGRGRSVCDPGGSALRAGTDRSRTSRRRAHPGGDARVRAGEGRLPGGGVETRNFFDVPVEDGVATIPLAGRERGDRIEVLAHIDARPQQNLEAETVVLRRPDLTVTQIDVPEDLVRTHAFEAVAMVAEVPRGRRRVRHG